MRYSGGLLGGTWLSSMVSDLSDWRLRRRLAGEISENLNRQATFWKVLPRLRDADTEPPCFLEVRALVGASDERERSNGSQNLFVGNKLADRRHQGEIRALPRPARIRSPRSVLFASMGDNITP